MATTEERETRRRFAERYRDRPTGPTVEIERAVIGGDWGANGYTTMTDADLLGDRLGLRPGVRLLDLGAGRGWPGLYLAVTRSCHAVLADVPVEGLRHAADRVQAEHVSDHVGVIAANARALPFRPGVYDAIVHTDVLC
jgi:tRNA1(Val) A37 N6-methylase TrmN6